MTAGRPADTPIETLERWALFGGHWRALEVSDSRATVELRACTGEPMDRLESDDAALIAYVRSSGGASPPDPPGTA